MKGKTVIIFNDVIVATTVNPVTYDRDDDDQKEYRFTNTKSGLAASLFCKEIEIIPHDHIVVEIF
ncbi:MAG: hypothetical protein JXN63_08090 [Candidatus Delongbacteria bacterium]|nr:hypothetical protein [Candidatus Delongbacteria bacterium]